MQRYHTDGGGENCEPKIYSVLEHGRASPDTPEHNPRVERANRTSVNLVKTFLEEAGLPAKY